MRTSSEMVDSEGFPKPASKAGHESLPVLVGIFFLVK